jgi:hypothetical protein
MKTLFSSLVALSLFAGSSYAAIYNLTTGTGAVVSGFVDSENRAFQNNSSIGLPAGVVSFGIFNVSDAALQSMTNPASLLSAFQTFGGPGIFSNAGPIGQRGTFAVSGATTVAGSAFAGQNAYVLVGNAATFAAATEFAVLRTNFVFSAADDSVPTPITFTVTPGNSALIIGNPVANVPTTTTDTSINPGWQTVVLIPEPSTALLGLIGALGLLRRRR